ncbi:hypothetical protein TWF281_000118 [Arthrobotrys megalospora]
MGRLGYEDFDALSASPVDLEHSGCSTQFKGNQVCTADAAIMRLRYLTSLCFLHWALASRQDADRDRDWDRDWDRDREIDWSREGLDNSGFKYSIDISTLAQAPNRTTGDTSEYRIPIDGETFAGWNREVTWSGLVEAFLEAYERAGLEWERIFYGLPPENPDPYNPYARTPCLIKAAELFRESLFDTFEQDINKGEEVPIWFRNMVVTWGNMMYEIAYSTVENPFYRVRQADPKKFEPEFVYPVAMLNKDFPEDFRDALRFMDLPLSRPTADHLHLLFMPRFQGPQESRYNRHGIHTESRYEKVARYLLNAVEISATGEDARRREFQFVVSDFDLDVSLQYTVYVDPNKTTRMRESLLKLRDRLMRIMNEGLELAWDIRTELGFLDSKVAGINKTMEEEEIAIEQGLNELPKARNVPDFDYFVEIESDRPTPRKRKGISLFQKWQTYKTLIVDVTYMPRFLIEDLDYMAEVLRVMEVPQLPRTEQSVDFAKDLALKRPAEPIKQMRLSHIETMDSPMNRDTSPGGFSQIPLKPDSLEVTPREGFSPFRPDPDPGPGPEDRTFEELINIIPISLDFRDNSDADAEARSQGELLRAGSSPNAAEDLKLLSTDMSPSPRSFLQPGYSPGSRNYSPPRRSLFSGANSRFTNAVNKANE